MAAKKKASPKLTANKRRSLSAGDFALPGKPGKTPGAKGSYPMDTPGRAQNALGKSTRFASPAEQATIKKRVAAKYPNMKISKGGKGSKGSKSK